VPVQNDFGWKVVPVHDTPAPQDTVVAACVQAPAPLQVPMLPQGGLAAHWPEGAAVPGESGAHVPAAVAAVVPMPLQV